MSGLSKPADILSEALLARVSSPAPGLHIVATPIGNLADISLRALKTLICADLVLCEDTRVTHRLFERYGVSTPLAPYHDHNAAAVRPGLIEKLRQGATLALVSDAGTPLVSDPGYKLVREAAAAGVTVFSVPGPSAALAALTVSGLPSDRFLFAGFLPPKQGPRRRAIAELEPVPASLIFYEGPSRVGDCLADLADLLGDREAAVARELTKLHEEVVRGRLADLAARFAEAPPRGEIVLVVGPPQAAADAEAAESRLDAALREALSAGRLKTAVAEVAAKLGLPRKQVYARALALTEDAEKDG